jgi:uncharacterized repeat protein (TIGR03843 family)
MFSAQEKTTILQALHSGKLTVQGQFVMGSNYTFLAKVETDELSYSAVYKPTRGEQPLWDFPTNSLAKREAAAFVLSEALGWNLVPPTIYRRKGPLGAGSLQIFISHEPEYHYFKFTPEDHQRLKPTAVFDLLVNNADRKGSHILKDESGHLWLIDQGLCFHVEDKLRTVIWEFAGLDIPNELLIDIERIIPGLEKDGELFLQLKGLLRLSEIRAIQRRGLRMLQFPSYPFPPAGARPYPWPPV